MRAPRGWEYSLLPGSGPTRSSNIRSDGQSDVQIANRFKPLFTVTVHHDYYDGSGGRCPDFAIQPSDATAELMRSQGLVFRQHRYGFAVYFNEQYAASLLGYLRRQGQRVSTDPESSPQYWTRMSFVMVTRNPLFVGITSIPIHANPIDDNLYAANSSAHWERGKLLLARGDAMNWSDRYPVTPAQFPLGIPDDAVGVVVLDISGAPVLFVPVAVEVPPLTFVQMDLSSLPLGLYTIQIMVEIAEDKIFEYTPGTPAEYTLGLPPDAAGVVVSQVVFDDKGRKASTIVKEFAIQKMIPPLAVIEIDFSGLPYATYEIQVLAVGDAPLPQIYVYTSRDPIPLCFLDILFSCPKLGMGGVYPVPPLFFDDDAAVETIGDVHYELRFEARSTLWLYNIVSQNGGAFTELEIHSDGVQFRREQSVPLPNGEKAAVFISDAPLPLRELSKQEFKLKGRRVGTGCENEIRVARLPVAPDMPVWPGPTPDTGISEMFVYV